MADEEAGVIEIFAVNDDGSFVIDPETGNRKIETLKGVVEIVTTYH